MSYENIYKKYYLNFPKMIAIFVAILLSLSGLLEVIIATNGFDGRYKGILEFIVGHDVRISEIYALAIWCALSCLIAYVIHFFVKVAISQKIVVVDRLTQIAENTKSNQQ